MGNVYLNVMGNVTLTANGVQLWSPLACLSLFLFWTVKPLQQELVSQDITLDLITIISYTHINYICKAQLAWYSEFLFAVNL